MLCNKNNMCKSDAGVVGRGSFLKSPTKSAAFDELSLRT